MKEVMDSKHLSLFIYFSWTLKFTLSILIIHFTIYPISMVLFFTSQLKKIHFLFISLSLSPTDATSGDGKNYFQGGY